MDQRGNRGRINRDMETSEKKKSEKPRTERPKTNSKGSVPREESLSCGNILLQSILLTVKLRLREVTSMIAQLLLLKLGYRL